MSSTDALQAQFEAEFCPPLDSNLVAALLADTGAGSEQQIEILREQLAALAAQAIVDNCSMKDKTPSPHDDIYGSGSSHMASSQYSAETSTTTDSPSLESPLAFLRQAFPDISVGLLQDALHETGQTESLNMQRLVEVLLSQELLAAFERENVPSPTGAVEEEWQEVTKKMSIKGKKAARAKAVPLIDMRQRQHQSPPRASVSPTTAQRDTNPWSHLASLATYLSDLLPPHSASEFLSAFHSPQHATPHDAVTSFLNTLKPGKREETAVDNDLITLMTLCVGDDQDEEGFDAILARKCILATEGRMDDALDLFKLVQDLEFTGPIVHLPAPTLSLSTRQNDPLTIRPLASPSPTRAKSKLSIPTKRTATRQSTQRLSSSSAQAAPNSWTYIEKRKPTAMQPNPHAAYIPSYQQQRYHVLIATETPEKSVEAANHVRRHRAVEESWQMRRAEALRKASRHWQQSRNGYGGQVAAYYADEARKYLDESREAAMNAARAMVAQNRMRMGNTHPSKNTIDLHGLTREESLVIVRDALEERALQVDPARRDAPLRIITGRGNHSAGNVSVLGPFLTNTLKAEGWSVHKVDGGIVVNSRTVGP